MNKKQLIDAIADLEWKMFSTVNNEGSKAACQRDITTFRIMRNSQSFCWSVELLSAYLMDLTLAEAQGRNLMSEKYVRMMESTFPDEYARLADKLPEVDALTARQIEEIVIIHVAWKESLDSRYPHLADRSRPVHTRDDSPGLTSLETYMRAELKTFSPKTIALYHTATLERLAQGKNEAEEILLHQVRHYGYESLEQAEVFSAPGHGAPKS